MHKKILISFFGVVLAAMLGCGTTQDKAVPAPEPALASKEMTREPLYPRVHDLGDSLLTVYEPQVISHVGYTQVTAWVAVVNQLKSGGERTIGALKVTADMVADFDNRTATLYNRRLVDTYFPELSETERDKLIQKIKALARNEPETMPLDTVLAYITQSETSKDQAARISMQPPDILYSDRPALLVQFGGDPVFKPIGDDVLVGYAVNTNWDVLRADGRYYLLLGRNWISAGDPEDPWQPAVAPVKASALPDGKRFDRLRQAIPGQNMTKADIPRIFVVTKPTELIVTDGLPKYETIAGTSLTFVANSSQDIVYQPSTKTYYLLLSGRWFQARKLKGPWSANEALPEEFSKIPDDHPRAHVRAAIPGTDEAKMAVVEANIPTTAAVPRKTQSPKVKYSSDPVFEAIKGTSVARAVNTSFDVLRVDNRYYLCYEAVWFESDRPTGPWIVADRVPQAIYTIPPDSPAYPVTFVRIYEADDEQVLVGYTSGYHSTYVVGTTVVYGSGYYWLPYWTYYPWGGPWYWYDDDWYGYYPYPYSYGSASFYNPVTGTYRHGDYTYGPGGGYGTGGSYNERTGRTSQSEYRWDYNSGVYESQAYNPKRGTTSNTRQEFRYDNPNSYESWGNSTITKGDQWIKTKRYSNQNGRTFGYETSEGGKGARIVKDGNKLGVAKTADGDLYVGGKGNVYRRNDDGSWQKRENGGWSNIDTSLTNRPNNKVGNITPAQRDAARQRVQNRSTSNRARSTNRRSYQNLNRNYRARSFGNTQFNRGRSGGRSFSGGGLSRGGGARRGGGRLGR